MAMVNRIVVGAHYGLKDWMAQRITAVVMALYTLILIVALLVGPEVTQERWKSLLSGQFMRVATFLFIVSVCYHAWVGMRDTWMDYLKPAGQRLLMHVITVVVLVAYAGWAIQILWRLPA